MASEAEGSSMSMAVIRTSARVGGSAGAWADLWAERRWAAIRAMVPVPVPMSRRWRSVGRRVIAAPRRTPSVLTFIAERSLLTENC